MSKTIDEQISEAATEMLSACVDDYASRIWDVIGDDVIYDVLQCTDECSDGFTKGDVALSIGRAIAERFGLEV